VYGVEQWVEHDANFSRGDCVIGGMENPHAGIASVFWQTNMQVESGRIIRCCRSAQIANAALAVL
jgi:hypothetical protein